MYQNSDEIDVQDMQFMVTFALEWSADIDSSKYA
jgi:hypothetical protein